MKLSELTKKTRAGMLLVEGETLVYTYYYQLVTPALIAAVETMKNGQDLLAVSQYVATLIASWDLEDVDGGVFPLEVSRLQKELPLIFQMQLVSDIITAMHQGEARAT